MARVVLTQPLPRVEALAGTLSAHGHDVATLAFTRVRSLRVELLEARIVAFDWVVAVSPAALDELAVALARRWPARGPGLALIGPGSVATLERLGWEVPPDRVLVPSGPPFDAAALLRTAPLSRPSSLRVLVVRGDTGREDWIEALRRDGALVDVMALYEREPVVPDSGALAQLGRWRSSPMPVFCLFTQAGSAAALCALPEAAGLVGVQGQGIALAIHGRIADAARAVGFHHVRLIEPGEEAILAALE
ncbi:MAG: hypothetical protein FJY25_21650 [Betaproteobacteria bacterium]|nr:hypothetical protein [Betaproteobacteria bacterium]